MTDVKGKGHEKRGFLGKLKDKAIGTKEERAAAKQEVCLIQNVAHSFCLQDNTTQREREVRPSYSKTSARFAYMTYSERNTVVSSRRMLRSMGHRLKYIRGSSRDIPAMVTSKEVTSKEVTRKEVIRKEVTRQEVIRQEVIRKVMASRCTLNSKIVRVSEVEVVAWLFHCLVAWLVVSSSAICSGEDLTEVTGDFKM